MRRGACIPGLIVCLLLAGCHSGLQPAVTNNDPFFGPPPAGSGGAATIGTPSQPAGSGGAIPPLLAPTGTTSLAALTGGVQQSLDSETPLRIPATPVSRQDSGPSQGIQLGQPQALDPSISPHATDPGSAGFPASGEDAPVSLTAPVVAGSPNLSPGVLAPSTIAEQVPATVEIRDSGPGDNSLMYSRDQLLHELEIRGVSESGRDLRRVPNSNEWEFICKIPLPNDPDTFTKFRAFAAGMRGEDDGGNAAIRKVIVQIDQSLHR